jgi:hypothetical protein
MTETQSLADRLAPQLEGARHIHRDLAARIAEVTLAAAVDATPEAVADRDDLNKQLAGAQINLDQFERAYTLAQHRDRLAECEREQAAHAEILAEFERMAAQRVKAARALSSALERAAREYANLHAQTALMSRRFPTGVTPTVIPWAALTYLVDGIGFTAPVDVVIAGEAHRHTIDAAGVRRPPLPGARPAHLSHQDQPGKIEPLGDVVSRANGYVLQELRAGFERLQRAMRAQAEKKIKLKEIDR